MTIPGKKISQFPDGGAVQDTDQFVIARAGQNYSISGSQTVGTTPYRIAVSVASNNLTLALKDRNGNDPSATSPVRVQIGDTVRTVTSALSVTKNAGTNWCNSGSSELATKEIDYFAYLGYNATDGVTIGFSRIPFARIYSGFSATTTNEKYAAISTITNAASSDAYTVIGRFAATLSAGAGYTWSVPTFTSVNLIHRPIDTSRWLDWVPAWSAAGAGSPTYSSVSVAFAKYRIMPSQINILLRASGTTGGTTVAIIRASLPFQSKTSADSSGASIAVGFGSVGGVVGGTGIVTGTPDLLSMFRYDLADMGIGAGRVVNISGFMEV